MSSLWHLGNSNANGFPEHDGVVSYINKKIFKNGIGIQWV